MRVQGRQAVARPVRLMPRPLYLFGRDQLLAQLHGRLTESGASPGIIALHGLGGVGKTSTAVEYAYRHTHEYGLVWQVAAEDPATLSAGLTDLAALLGARDLVDSGDPISQVHAALAARRDRWLLILDNVEKAADIRHVLPSAGTGHVVITTRSGHWPFGQSLEVPVLDQGAAAEFLQARTGEHDAVVAAEVADQLGSLPLALEQAAGFLHAAAMSLSEYLTLLRDQRMETLAHGRAWGYDKKVTSTWTIAFQRLQATCPEALTLLRLLACCAPEQIPYTLLLHPSRAIPTGQDPAIADMVAALRANYPFTLAEAVAELRDYSLISRPVNGTTSVHRLVQEVTVGQLTSDEHAAWRQMTGALITAALPPDPRHNANWPVYGALMAHARVALTPDSHGMKDIVAFLGASGAYAAAKIVQRQIHDHTTSSLGTEHPDTLTARFVLALWTGEAGDAVAARDMFAALLPIDERVLGPEHPETLNARFLLARWTGEAGDAVAARDAFAVLLPVYERVLGMEHPDTLNARYSLARWTGEAGDAVAARDMFAALLPTDEQVLGPEHPETLNVRYSMARWTGEAGDAVAARDMCAVLLPVRERVLGPEHPDTLSVQYSLARWAGEAGDAVAARDMFVALLRVRERLSGVDHPYTLDARYSLAHWTGHAGDAAAARDMFAALLPMDERVSGATHANTLKTRRSMDYWSSVADAST